MKMKKVIALLLATLLLVGMFVGCGPTEKEDNTPLVVGYSPFNSKFSAFFAETAYDQDVAGMTGLSLLTSDRTGAIILKGIDGETVKYNGTDYTYYGPANLVITQNADGTVYYDFTLKDGLKFSDGEPVTIDDVIFSMYVLCDPTYDGSSTLFAQPILGMEAYRSGMTSKQNAILTAGPDGYKATDCYTEEEYTTYWAAFMAAGADFCQDIVDYCLTNYAAYGAKDTASAAALWGYTLTAEQTVADMFDIMIDNYGYDISDDGINCEAATNSISYYIEKHLGDKTANYQKGVKTGESADKIEGIQKTGDNTLRIVMTKVDATAIYQLGVTIAPLHYYGSKDLYDYANNKFGFAKGDLSSVRAKTTQPLGAGPYKFIKFENGVVYFEANENYFKGTPKTKYVNFQQCTTDDDKLNGVVQGTIDITDPSYSNKTVKAIKEANGGDSVVGSKITTNTVNNLGYGYIGVNADRVYIGNDHGSTESRYLRKAFGTIFSVYRDVAIDSYYGDRASVINYPISDTSWAAPRSSDDGYKVAFSTKVDGTAIYTSTMTAEEKYAAAKQAALEYFEAAGYTVVDGKVTKAPEGAKLEYEAWIPADGTGDHPSFMIFTEASKALETIGITLVVKDLTNSSDLWTGLEAGNVDIWAAAWGATVDPDMYQIYYSDIANGQKNPGGSNYMYDIKDATLDEAIIQARSTTDQAVRKVLYKACLDSIVDWATEIPVYQRQNAIIFSTERVNMSTVTPDITTFYGWMSEIENIELAKK